MKTTAKDLLKVLSVNREFSTPQQVIDYLDEKYNIADNIDPNDMDAFVICGTKAMYMFNHLFGSDVDITDDEISKYALVKDDVKIEYLYDGDIDCEWSEDIDFFKEENIPYIACIDKCYSDLKSFLNTLSIICKETNDTIKFECFTTEYFGEYLKSGFEIDSNGNIAFYGPDVVLYEDDFFENLYVFLSTLNCKSFDDINSLDVPVITGIDKKEAFEQFFGAAGFGKFN